MQTRGAALPNTSRAKAWHYKSKGKRKAEAKADKKDYGDTWNGVAGV
jgi:hypothetical protein